MCNRCIFSSVVVATVSVMVLVSACSDTPTDPKHLDTMDGDAVLMAAQVTSEIRYFTPKGTVITKDAQDVKSVQKGDMFGWQPSPRADSDVKVQALIGVGPCAHLIGSSALVSASRGTLLPALNRLGAGSPDTRFHGRHEVVSHRDSRSGHVISVATLHDDDELPGSPARQMFIFVDGKPTLVMGMRHAWRGGHWTPKKIHILAFDSTGTPLAEINQSWNFADTAVAFLNDSSGHPRKGRALATLRQVLKSAESFAESTFLPDEAKADEFENPWGFDDGWYDGGLHDETPECDKIQNHYNYVLGKLFVEGYGTPFEVADCGEAILAAVGSGGVLTPVAVIACGVTAFSVGYYIYELWELNQLQNDLSACRHAHGIADNSAGASGSYWSDDGTESVDFTSLNEVIEEFIASYGSGWQCTADGEYCIDLSMEA